MRDFLIKPNLGFEHGVFLVRNLSGFNLEILSLILEDCLRKDLYVSFEKLFKDSEAAFVIFGPKTIISKYQRELNLLELEDYANLDLNFASVFEISIQSVKDLRLNLPKLAKDERVWIQLITKGGAELFPYQARAVLYSANRNLAAEFQKNYKNILPKIPKPFSRQQLFEFYKMRSFLKGDTDRIKKEDILSFLYFL